MPVHPAESRGYRELYLTGRAAERRLGRLAAAFGDTPQGEALGRLRDSIVRLLAELAPLTARHDLHGGITAQGGGANIGVLRGAVLDRFLERNQALRLAVDDAEHLPTLLGYLANASEARGDETLPDFCRAWERRLHRQVGALRKQAIELGRDPDAAIAPLDPSPGGRAAHRVAWALGSAGEWTDRKTAGRRRS